MEDIHGVDVSWLHHNQRSLATPQQAIPSPPSAQAGKAPQQSRDDRDQPTSAPAVQQPAPPVATPPPPKTPVKRPPLLSRGSAEKAPAATAESRPTSRRNSWISSISSKFSSQSSPAQTTPAQAQGAPASSNSGHPFPSANGALNGIQAANREHHTGLDPYVPQPPRGSFISNALRRLSSGTQVGAGAKPCLQGGICPRIVMNINHNRKRCLVPELEENKLRRVAFCVDVEIAGGPKYKDDADAEDKKKKSKDRKLKEKGEGEALKHPDVVARQKEQEGFVVLNDQQKEVVGTAEAPNPEGGIIAEDEKKEPSRKKEKKKRSEAERKERKEKKRRRAEESGSIPLELTREEDDANYEAVPTASAGPAAPRPQYRPTTDPLRIYRRCCQLRETPALKRVSEQLADPNTSSVVTPGVVTCLDLTGSRMSLADVITLSDWLAIVPVKKLFLEDADLDDEKVRLILAGILAAKIPTAPRRRPLEKVNDEKPEDRPGVILKLVLVNNPKIGPEGWKHISLFIYMCKSIQAIDLSMIPFPNSTPQLSPRRSDSTHSSHGSSRRPARDVADIFSKAVSERLGGSRLEELVLAECSLTASSIRKIVDGVIVSGVQRLGLATNTIDSEGLDHVIHYIKSGVCQGLDMGGNDLRDEIERLAQSVTQKCPLWALCLANCNLTPESLKILFPALVKLPTFRFLDLSHNRDLFAHKTSLGLLRKYIPQFKELKRLHLMDVSLTPEGTIGLAEVLPECAHLAHISILENPAISAVASATDEASQEEAVALYASLMVAAKLSRTLICIDVDVPGTDSSEMIKALAKQVVAFCLRNMETFSEILELKEGAELVQKEVEYPNVLRHLVIDGVKDPESDPPPADEDYIVGGTGVVKALSYCLLQKASDLRRRSSFPGSGTVTPTRNVEEAGKAKEMSKDLLEGARTIRSRLQPALVREARAGNDMGYRRLLFLDQTLQNMINRFEEEYPETRLHGLDDASTHSSVPSSSPPASHVATAPLAVPPEHIDSDEDEPRTIRSRHNSDVSLASRALSQEEGRLHRLGHRVRTEIINASRPSSSHSDQANVSGTMDNHGLPEHLAALRDKYFGYSGEEIRHMSETLGWETAFDQLVENAAELKTMMEENPEEFKLFRDTQLAALRNRNPDAEIKREDRHDDFAVEG